MAQLMRRACLAGRGIELILNRTMCKQHLKIQGGVNILRMLYCTETNEDVNFRSKMWRTIKKNDPEMDNFLGSPHIQQRIKDLTRVMSCTVERATELVKRDSKLGVKDPIALYRSIGLLMSYGFTVEDIISHPSVLHRAYSVLQQRLESLDKFKRPPSERSLYILTKTNFDFKAYLKSCAAEEDMLSKYSSLQHCIASLLDCNAGEAKDLIEKYKCESISLVLLKSKIDIFRRFQIPNSVIRKCFYTLIYLSSEAIETRLQILMNNGLLEHPYVGLGYIMHKTDKFEKSVHFLINKKNALEGYEDKVDYLIFRLKCPRRVAEGFVSNTIIKHMSEIKLKKMLDLFLEEMGVSCDFVISNANLMTYSYERMQSRWDFISNSEYNTSRWLSKLLSMSDHKFQELVKNSNHG